MPFQSVRDRYVSDGAGVIPQARLLVMLFDRLVLDVQQAEDALSHRRIAEANDRLTHAQSILLELHAALDVNTWAAGAQLAELYLWLTEELMQANVNKDAKALAPCLRMLIELQGAWQNAYEQVGNTPLSTFAVPTPNTSASAS